MLGEVKFMAKSSQEHSNLLFSKEFRQTLLTEERIIREPKLAQKIQKSLDNLNSFGTDSNYHPKRCLKSLGNGWWSLRIKHLNNYWRIMFRRTDSSQYGLTIMFLKKEDKITQRHWDVAKNVAKREGWL